MTSISSLVGVDTAHTAPQYRSSCNQKPKSREVGLPVTGNWLAIARYFTLPLWQVNTGEVLQSFQNISLRVFIRRGGVSGYRNVARKPQATRLSRSKSHLPSFGTGYRRAMECGKPNP